MQPPTGEFHHNASMRVMRHLIALFMLGSGAHTPNHLEGGSDISWNATYGEHNVSGSSGKQVIPTGLRPTSPPRTAL